MTRRAVPVRDNPDDSRCRSVSGRDAGLVTESNLS